MSGLMLYWSCLHSYTPYARGLRFCLVDNTMDNSQEEIGKTFIVYRAMNEFSYYILLIIYAYNTGISRLRSYTRLRLYVRLWSKDVSSVVYMTPVARHDSGCMHDSSQKTRLRSEGMTPVVRATPAVVCLTLVGRHDSGCMRDSGQKTWLQSYAQFRSKDVTLVVCPTPIARRDSSRMLDFGRKMRLWLYTRLRSYSPTLVTLPDSNRHHNYDRISWLRSCITALVEEHAACLTSSSVKDYAWSS
jgi:hypothetical protein